MTDQSDSRKFEDFLQQLLDATEEGRVDWQDTASGNTFIASLKHGSVHIEREYDFDENDRRVPIFSAYLYDPKGRLAEELTASRMLNSTLLPRLYELARRSARETDSLLDKVVADLQANKGG